MDADTWKILIGALAVVVSGLGGQYLAGRNARLTADATHDHESKRWARDLKYTTYFDLVEQFETSFRLMRTFQRTGSEEAKAAAQQSLNSLRVPALRLVAPSSIRNEANELDAAFRKWFLDMPKPLSLTEQEALGDTHLEHFRSFVASIRRDLGTETDDVSLVT